MNSTLPRSTTPADPPRAPQADHIDVHLAAKKGDLEQIEFVAEVAPEKFNEGDLV